jgi:hypothetical protein
MAAGNDRKKIGETSLPEEQFKSNGNLSMTEGVVPFQAQGDKGGAPSSQEAVSHSDVRGAPKDV